MESRRIMAEGREREGEVRLYKREKGIGIRVEESRCEAQVGGGDVVLHNGTQIGGVCDS